MSNRSTSYELDLNPWIDIWRKPKETICQVLDSGYGKTWWLLLLSSVSGIYDVFMGSLNRHLNLFTVLFLMFTLGLVGGIVIWLVESLIFLVIGKVFKRKSSWNDMLRAVAWSKIPLILILVICFLPMVLLFGEVLFNTEAAEPVHSALLGLGIILMVLFLTILVWYIYIISNAIAAVHDLNPWIGFSVYLIGKVVYTIITGGVFLVIVGVLVFLGV